ncbi:PAS domain S-box protein [Methanoregula sp.]|uniref:PAS domain S-box protein n=1 Tax=Methanoregula sp. TaxID=2052170 RepID=UPI0035679942
MQNTIRILYVDDDRDLLDIGKLFLEEDKGFSVDCVLSGKDALAHIRSEHYDAVVSDYQMPKMDGITLLKTVRAEFRTLPFILFTGKGREEVVIEALNNGADFYLQKGGDPESQFAELSHKIRQAVQQRRAETIIHDHERREADILNFLPDATFAIDKNGVVIAWNRAIEEMTGVPAQDMIGRGDHEYAIPFYGIRRPILIDLIFAPELEIRSSYSFVRVDGDVLTSETNNAKPRGKEGKLWGKAVPLYDMQGAIIGAIESIRDITERRRLEETLEKEHQDLHAAYEQVAAAEEELRAQYDHLAESERALRKNEERLTMAEAIGHTGSWEYDIETGKIWGSAEAIHTFGYPPVAGYLSLADIEACIPERVRVHQALVDMITTGKIYALEFPVHPADGSAPKVIFSSARLEKDAYGIPVRVIGVIQDITERKRVEEEITFKNIILSTQQETAPDGILVVDESGKILYYNQKFVGVWEIPDTVITSGNDEPVLQFVVEQLADPEAFLSRVRYLYKRKGEKSSEELMLKDGRVLERFSAPMLGETGKYYGRVWYFRDITGRKQAEESLRMSEDRFHTLYTHMTEGAALHELTCDEHGVPEDYLIVETNPAFETHLGIARDAVIGKTSRQAYGVTEPPYLDIYARVATTGLPAVFETYFPPLDKYFSISTYSPAKGRFATIFEDITKRKRAEEQNREAREVLEGILNSIQVRVFWKDRNLKYIGCNTSFARDAGFEDPEDIIGRDDYAMGWRDQADLYRSDDRAVIESGGSKLFIEEPQKTPSGNTITLLTTKIPLRNDTGEVIGVLGTYIDITERKRAEDTLRESDEKYRLATEKTGQLLYDYDIASGKIHWSGAIFQVTGYMMEEFPPVDIDRWKKMVHPDDRTSTLAELARTIGRAENYHVEYRFLKKDGTYIPMESSGGLITDSTGGACRMIGTQKDISQKKQMEADLRKSEENYRLTLEATNDGFWDWNIPSGNAFFSPRWYTMLGYEPNEMPGLHETWRSLVHPEDLGPTEQRIRDHISNKDEFYTVECRMRTKDGDWKWILSRGKVIERDNKGSPIRMVGTHVDITTRKRAERELAAANEKLTLLSGITRHDIVNQITTLMGYRKLLEKKIADPQYAEYFQKIDNAAQRIAAMIRFTKEYEKIGVMAPVWQECSTIVIKAGMEAPLGTIRVENGIPAGIEVFADPLITRVFYNLMENAVQYGGKITTIEFSIKDVEGDKVIICKDDGDGIPADEKERIFDRGFGKNTGLGLALSREILDITGITIRETGEPGRGAEFEIRVPEGTWRKKGSSA